ncbi:hypothetical protein ACSVDA_01095 [Cytobacillus sp. Hm23]
MISKTLLFTQLLLLTIRVFNGGIFQTGGVESPPDLSILNFT